MAEIYVCDEKNRLAGVAWVKSYPDFMDLYPDWYTYTRPGGLEEHLQEELETAVDGWGNCSKTYIDCIGIRMLDGRISWERCLFYKSFIGEESPLVDAFDRDGATDCLNEAWLDSRDKVRYALDDEDDIAVLDGDGDTPWEIGWEELEADGFILPDEDDDEEDDDEEDDEEEDDEEEDDEA